MTFKKSLKMVKKPREDQTPIMGPVVEQPALCYLSYPGGLPLPNCSCLGLDGATSHKHGAFLLL